MARKILLDVDPGIADALALCLALGDPTLDVVAVTATGGCVPPDRATRNVQALIEQLDPQRWPRIGAADPQQTLRTDGRKLSGEDGFCGAQIHVAELHHQHSSVKVLTDEIRAAPGEVTIIACGPLSNIATALQREPDLAMQVGHLIIVGGTYQGPGNVTASAEFNIYCDPEAAKAVFRTPMTKTLFPLDVSSTVTLNFDLLNQLPDESTRTGRLLRKLLPGAFRAYRQQLALEGILAPEALAVVAAQHPELIRTKPLHADVEVEGELTHGATVLDRRSVHSKQPNMDVIVDLEAEEMVDRLISKLRQSP